ncbi:hypothetical protein QR98_0063910 [Sarcoptes scabiei]|uniref:EF-hand domain-containing protein n=1 Tax=Sarcoptes scabiei TaxID=52283 RepID=A0A132AAE7_SARSC|nr:hypothetical protein QR98_0063910 [Sarcoptes scabiei]
MRRYFFSYRNNSNNSINREEFITVCGDGIDNEALNFNQFVQDYIDKDDDGDCDRDLIEESRQQNSDANLNRSDGKVFQTKSTANSLI